MSSVNIKIIDIKLSTGYDIMTLLIGRETTNMPYKRLTERQRKFIRAMMVDGVRQEDAAIQAGYSPRSARSSGSDNMNNPVILREIEKVREERLKKVGVTFEKNAVMLRELAEACMEGTRLNDKGYIHPVGAYQPIDMLNKMGGFYAPEKREIDNHSIIDFELLEKYEKDV